MKYDDFEGKEWYEKLGEQLVMKTYEEIEAILQATGKEYEINYKENGFLTVSFLRETDEVTIFISHVEVKADTYAEQEEFWRKVLVSFKEKNVKGKWLKRAKELRAKYKKLQGK